MGYRLTDKGREYIEGFDETKDRIGLNRYDMLSWLDSNLTFTELLSYRLNLSAVIGESIERRRHTMDELLGMVKRLEKEGLIEEDDV